MNLIDPLQLQRLIDGELEIDELQRLLASLENESDQWKTIATSFIENQLLQTQFDTMEGVMAPPVDKEIQNISDSTSLPYTWLMSLAASAMLTLSIGVLIGSNYLGQDSSTQPAPVAGGTHQLVSKQNEQVPMSTPALYRMQLQDEQGNRFIDTDIPFYNVANWNDVNQHQFEEYPVDVRNRIRNSGYDMQHNTRFLQGRLNDGRRFVIPVRNTKFEPYQ